MEIDQQRIDYLFELVRKNKRDDLLQIITKNNKLIYTKNDALYEALRIKGKWEDDSGFYLIHFASLFGRDNIVKDIIGIDANAIHLITDRKFHSAHYAADCGALSLLKYFMEELKIDKDIRSISGWSILHSAAYSNQLHLVKYLVEELGMSEYTKCTDGVTPLHAAAFKDNLEVVKYLVEERKMDDKIKRNDGWIPLHESAFGGSLETAKYFLNERKIDKYFRGYDECSQLHIASFNGHLPLVKYLVDECGMDVDDRNGESCVPLHCACVEGHMNLIRYFIEDKKAVIGAICSNGWTMLHEASAGGHLELIKYLLHKQGFDKDVQRKNGWSSLFDAIDNGHISVVKYLIEEEGANENLKDNIGCTPLHFAVLKEEKEITELLVSYGCEISKDEQGKTCVDYAPNDEMKDFVLNLLQKRKRYRDVAIEARKAKEAAEKLKKENEFLRSSILGKKLLGYNPSSIAQHHENFSLEERSVLDIPFLQKRIAGLNDTFALVRRRNEKINVLKKLLKKKKDSKISNIELNLKKEILDIEYELKKKDIYGAIHEIRVFTKNISSYKNMLEYIEGTSNGLVKMLETNPLVDPEENKSRSRHINDTLGKRVRHEEDEDELQNQTKKRKTIG